jgi:hypothetical protein
MRKLIMSALALAMLFGAAPAADAHRVYNAKAIDWFLSLQDPDDPTNANNPPEWSGLCGSGRAGGDTLACLNGDKGWEHPGLSTHSMNGAFPRAFLTDFDHNGTAKSGGHSYQFRGSYVEYEDTDDIFADDWADPECRTVRIRANISAHSPGVDNPYPGSPLGWPYIWFDRQFLKKVSGWYDCGVMVDINCRGVPAQGCDTNPSGWPSPERARMDVPPATLSSAEVAELNEQQTAAAAERNFNAASIFDNPETEDTTPTSWCDETSYAEDYPSPDGVVTGDGSSPSGWTYDDDDPDDCGDSTYDLTDNVQETIVSGQAAEPDDGDSLYSSTDWVSSNGVGYEPNNNFGVVDPEEAYAVLWASTLSAAKVKADANGADSDDASEYQWAGTGFTSLYNGTDADVCVTHSWPGTGGEVNVTYCEQVYETTGGEVTAVGYNRSVNGRVDITD